MQFVTASDTAHFISASSLGAGSSCAQKAETAALAITLKNGGADISKMVAQYDARRRIMVDGFRKIGLDCFEPQGAFYAFPCIKSSGLTSSDFCEKLLYSQRVAIIPGTAFGAGGEGFVRASYCYSVAHIKEAIERIDAFMKELRG